ncbi:MAG: histidine phosphatase family protein [Candidatus Dormibacteria bacterium]
MTDGRAPVARALSSLERAFLIGVEGVTELYLVRHGQADADPAAGPDPGLSLSGRAQAQRLSRRLERHQPAAVISSPLRRALETASLLSPEVRPDARLIEARVEVRGQRLEQLEPAAEVVARVDAALQDVVATHRGGRIIVVSHGRAILNYLEHVLGLPPGGFRFFPQCASVSLVRVQGDRSMIGPLGDVARLEE